MTHALCSAAMGEPLSCLNFIRPQKLSKHDNFLVLASDGIWDVFTKEDICRRVEMLLKQQEELPLSAICEEICNDALKKGKQDIMSTIIVEFNAKKESV